MYALNYLDYLAQYKLEEDSVATGSLDAQPRHPR
jgi:hypothetical protein